MAKKKFPYGYQMKKGKIVICEPEAEVIRTIFMGRAEGHSNWEMARELYEKQTDYFSDNVKKASCKISDILYDERYAGADGYEAIVDMELFTAVQKLRGKSWTGNQTAHCVAGRKKGDAVPKKVHTFSTVCIPNKDVFDKEKALKMELRSENADIEKIRNMILDLTSAKYDCIS